MSSQQPENPGRLESVPPSDRELVLECLSGDRNTYEILVRRYQSRVFGFILRMVHQRDLARDLVQEAFWQAYSRLDTCQQPDKFFVWLLRIAKNLTLNALNRVEGRMVPVGLSPREAEAGPAAGTPGKGPESIVEERETAQELCRLVKALPSIYRSVVVLRHAAGRTSEEIADVLEIPAGTVRYRLHRAYRLLKERLFKK